MSIASLLKSGLAANSGVAALVGTRIYPLVFVNNNPTLPAITYQRISGSGTNGSTALRESRYQINCWANTHVAASGVAAAVKAFAEEFSDTTSTPGIKMALVVNESDDYDDQTKIFRVIVDVMLTTTGD